MGTQIILSSPNYYGYIADITFFPQTGGTVNLGAHTTPYTVDLDYYYGTYQLCYSAFNKCCETVIIAPTPTPTNTQTPTNTTTQTQTPTTTQTPTPTTTTTLTATPTQTPTKTQTPTQTPTQTQTATNTQTPTNTPTPTITPSPTARPTYSYSGHSFTTFGSCDELLVQAFFNSEVPLSTGYYCLCPGTFTDCGGLHVISSVVRNYSYPYKDLSNCTRFDTCTGLNMCCN